MSSFETNTYSPKPVVNVGSAITVTKPIGSSNLLTNKEGLSNTGQKKIQPLLKPADSSRTVCRPVSCLTELNTIYVVDTVV